MALVVPVPRTPEQIAADEALREAIDRVMKVYEMLPEGTGPSVLTEYVVITCHQGFEDTGQGNARYNWTIQDDGMPWHRILGLVDMGKRQIETAMMIQWQEDD
jgi:hypothetical protein